MGKFQKGQPRPENAGRKKGTPNKRPAIFESLEKIRTAEGVPIDMVKWFIKDLNDLPAMQRAELTLRFIEYLYPKQRNVEVSAGEGFKIILEDYSKK